MELCSHSTLGLVYVLCSHSTLGLVYVQFAPLRKYQMEGFCAPKKVNARVQYIEKVNR